VMLLAPRFPSNVRIWTCPMVVKKDIDFPMAVCCTSVDSGSPHELLIDGVMSESGSIDVGRLRYFEQILLMNSDWHIFDRIG
jgi:hypothetical protein